jgi:hypothetical protein
LFFWGRVRWTICPGWLQTVILLISVSLLARITDVSHQRPTVLGIFEIGSFELFAQAGFDLQSSWFLPLSS